MRCCQAILDTPYASIVHSDVTLFMLTQEWLQNEWHHIIRRWRRIYEVLYIQKEELDLWTTIPKQYTVTVLIEDSALRYTSWFRAGSLQKSQTVAPPAKVSHPSEPLPDIRRHLISMQSNSQSTTQVSPRVDSIKQVKAKGEGEQPIDSISTKTVPNHSSMNWLSQWANKAPNNTEGRKAKKARKTQAISGSLVNGRSSDISTKVRNSLQSPSTDDRSRSCSSSSHDTQCGGDKPQERVQPRNEDNTDKLIKKRRLEKQKNMVSTH
jgi:hypothetical protein